MYARAQSITPHLDNSYTALAVNNETFDSVVGADLANIILACPIVAIVLVFIIVVMLLVVYTKRDQWKKRSPLTKSSKATLLSLTVLNASHIFFVFILDINAVSNRSQQLHPIHGQDKVGELYNILYKIPVVVFVFDLLATIPCYFTASPIYSYIYGSINDITDNQCYCFALSTIGVIISLLNHTPYMIMAYFIDPYYTTDVLIFYFFIVISWFSLLEFIFDYWLREPSQNSRNYNICCRKCKRICAYSTLFLVLVVSYIGLAYAVFLWFGTL